MNRSNPRASRARQRAGDLVGSDPIREECPHERTRADPTKKIQIDDRTIDETRVECAEHPEFPEQPFDAPARQTHGDSTAASTRKQSIDLREKLAQVRVDEDMSDAATTKSEGGPCPIATHIDHRDRAIRKNRARQRTAWKQVLMHPETERETLMARIQHQHVDVACHRRLHGFDVINHPNRDDAASSSDPFTRQYDAVLGASMRSRQLEQWERGSASSPDDNDPVHSDETPYVRKAN